MNVITTEKKNKTTQRTQTMSRKSTRKELLLAIRLNRTEKFRSILDVKGWPTDISSYDLLVKAITLERKQIVHILLDKNCRITTKPGTTTPLHMAVSIVGWSDVVERLLDLGCRVGDHGCRGYGNTPLHLAFLKHAPGRIIDRMLEIHLSEGGRNWANRDGLSVLHVACTRPNVKIVEKFVEVDAAFIDHPNFKSLYTPLHYAVEYDQHEVAEFLLKRGADINKQDKNESTPLHVALVLRKASMIDLLLKYDRRKKNIADKYGLSHFMVSCAGSDSDIVREHLDLAIESKLSPADFINSQVKNLGIYAGYTPLHFAADFGRTKTIELLLSYGADCCAMTLRGLTVHALAKERNHENVCDLLQEHCDVLARCRKLRAESPDFGKWGDNYENAVLIERARTMKHLRGTLRNMTTMSCSSEVFTSADDCVDNCFQDLVSELMG